MDYRFRIFLVGFRVGADLEKIEKLIKETFRVSDEKALKKMIFDVPSVAGEVAEESRAVGIRAELEALGARAQIKKIPVPSAPAGGMTSQKLPPSSLPPAEEAQSPAKPPSEEELLKQVEMMLALNRSTPRSYPYRYYAVAFAVVLCALFLVEAVVLIRAKPPEQIPDVSPLVITDGGQLQSETDEGSLIKNLSLTKLSPAQVVTFELSNSQGLQEAVKSVKAGDYDSALSILENYVKENPDDTEALNMLASVLLLKASSAFDKKDFDAAMEYLERAEEIRPSDPEILFQEGVIWYFKRDYDTAKRLLEDAVERGVKNGEPYLLLGLLYYYHFDDLERAQANLEIALSFFPEREDVRLLLNKVKNERRREERMNQAKGRHFTVKYEGVEDENAGYKVLYELERAYSTVGYHIGEYPSDTVTVILYTQKEFEEVIKVPHWAGGVYDGRIRLPVAGIQDFNDDNLRRLLYHEYTHALIHRLTNGNCPIWLNEGLAQVMQEQSGASKDPWLSVDNLRNRQIPTLSSLNSPFLQLSYEQAISAYVESYYATKFFLDNYGYSGLRNLFERLGKGENFTNAFKEVLGTDFSDFEERFYSHLRTIVE